MLRVRYAGRTMFRLFVDALLLLVAAVRPAHAVEVKISAQALERTLRAQLFNAPDGRYYMRGDRTSATRSHRNEPGGHPGWQRWEGGAPGPPRSPPTWGRAGCAGPGHRRQAVRMLGRKEAPEMR